MLKRTRKIAHSSALSLTLTFAFALSACVGTKGDPNQGGTDPKYEPSIPRKTIPSNLSCKTSGDEKPIFSGAGASSFAVLWEGDRYVVAYSNLTRGQGDIHVVQLDRMGNPLSESIVLDSTPSPSEIPSLASLGDGKGYVVAWEERSTPRRAVKARLLDSNARPKGPAVELFTVSMDEARPTVSASPHGIALAWMDEVQGIAASYIAWLDPSLAFNPAHPMIRLGSSEANAKFPWLVGDGKSLAWAWSDERSGALDIRFQQLGEAGLSEESVLRASTQSALLPRLVRTGSGFLAGWEDLRTGSEEIYVASVSDAGVKRSENRVEEPGKGSANWPNFAVDNQGAVGAVYYHFRDSGTPQIYFDLLNEEGAVISGTDLQVSHAAKSSLSRYPAIQWNGQSFGILWIDTRAGLPQLYFNQVVCSPKESS